MKRLKILLVLFALVAVFIALPGRATAMALSDGESIQAGSEEVTEEEIIIRECTSGVADADVTIDGRPLFWKLRNESHEINDVHYFAAGVEHYPGLGPSTYSFLGMGPADDSPGGPVRSGLNSQGLAIGFNYLGSSGWELLHRQSLGFYSTVSQVRTYLNAMTTLSAINYTIDRGGEATAWESQTGTGKHWEANTRVAIRDNQWIDVDNADNDDDYETGTDLSLSGWVVRANDPGHFNTDGTDDLDNYEDRYVTGREILGSLIYNNGNGTTLSAKSLATNFFRNNTLAFEDTVSNMIVQGVLPTEDPRLSTTWAMLGHSETGIFVPLWILGVESGGANHVPQYLDDGDDGISAYNPARGMYDEAFSHSNVQARTLPFEERLFDVVNDTLLPDWRSRNWTDAAVVNKIGEEMKRVQEQMDADAYGHLNYLYENGATSNYAPTVSINSVSYNELEATFLMTISDADGDTPTYLCNYGDGQTGSNSTHKYALAGHYLASCTVTDNHGVSQTDWLFATVTGVNDAPVVTIPDQTVPEGGTFTTINLDNYVSDPDDSDAQMVWTYSGNSAFSVSITARVATIGIPNADWNGAETITFIATDRGNLSGQDAAIFTVTAVDDAPLVTDIPNQTIVEGGVFVTINLDDYVSDVDNTDAELNWTNSGNSALGVSIAARVATITVPNADWNGSEIITFRATGPGGAWGQDTATFTVTGVNDAPVVSDIPNQVITEGAPFTVLNLDNYVSDVDNSDSQMNWTYSGQSALRVSIVNRTATITAPNVDWNGAETITFRAADPASLWSQDAATFTITAVNDAPICSTATLVTSMDMPGETAPICSDADSGSVLSYSIVDQGEHGAASIVAGRLHYVPDTGYTGSDTFTYKANDTLLDSNTATVNVSVTTVALGIPLQSGWNLVSFNVQPTSTVIEDVLANISGQYSIVYAWDNPAGWKMYDPAIADELNTLHFLDETIGFWIKMKTNETLVVGGSAPSNISIPLAAGWNLVGYPSAVNRTLPGALTDHGVDENDYSLVYAYHANEVPAARWKIFDPALPPELSTLTELTPGWGYWIKATAESTWIVP